ncbi:DNA translocase FtsK 4TM domain-containing protein [Salinisphaera sp. P385]|uniref:DNA translocase FtsK n=1 Tax=Spectribacter acetivorans TaxID=3075603 RepID=A0ABU3B381_9GAMM|nr:DNA translocase FtsK 4TM domain-containing protein [Salinisphaera sp. P385]MDT0616909.1 DNA translocase FtsK 4TM domain-containing protein [Salinisphaera sp. P385]
MVARSRNSKAPAPAKPADQSWYRQRLGRLLREASLFLAAACTLFLLAALISHSPTDPGWSRLAGDTVVSNVFGRPGAWFADVLLSLFGYLGFVFPWLILYAGWLAYAGGRQPVGDALSITVRAVSLMLWLTAGCGLASLSLAGGAGLPQGSGGILGASVAGGLQAVLNTAGAAWLLITLFIITLSTGLGFSWLTVTERVGRWVQSAAARVATAMAGLWQALRKWQETRRRKPPAPPVTPPAPTKTKPRRPPSLGPSKSKPDSTQLDLPMDAQDSDEPAVRFDPERDDPLPGPQLLDPARAVVSGYDEAALQRLSEELEQHLADFGVQAKVVGVQPGPVITRFELDPAPGVKVNQFTNLAKDLARAMSTTSVRVVEVIPGKSVVGLEIPNHEREIVALREILESTRYTASVSGVTLALGKDIGGGPVTADLGKMPHLLVAGTTGSGKSVAINVMILSILYKASPEQVRLIMIDPKMLELSVYEGIPHLLAPVVTDMKEAANALRWCVAEMERRYKLMAALGVRNIAGFNRKLEEARKQGRPIIDPLFNGGEGEEAPELEAMPAIVVIVDELADLMMVVGKKVEELIARLAQKARAAGLHMILATQRPSVDVITGLIKANIPTRIAFQVASRVDSRTILDQQGAESLLGHGDMLFLPPGTGLPTRVHGAFVDDHEVHKVVEFLKQTGDPDYNEAILSGAADGDDNGGGIDGGDAEEDPLYDQAVAVVTESRKASISYVQRRLRVGYNRAARLVEQMEVAGIVGPVEGGGSREVLAPPPPKD